MNESVHTFAGNPLDRGEALRRDEANIEALRQSAAAQFLVFSKLRVATHEQTLRWFSAADLEAMDLHQTVFLGVRDTVPLFAAALASNTQEIEFTDCRLIAAALATADTGILAQARSQLEWHQRNPFCAQCGSSTYAARGGHIRRCDACERHFFPRTDPVAIMLIIDEPGGDRCLLGQSQGRMASSNFYSALAGFVDQGESLEEAVRREVREEAGVPVGRVAYHSSQPWPFPSQLMIGCHGVALSQEIQIDPVEMADVRWFTRAEVSTALAEENPDLRVPGAMAIAHHLIRSWVAREVEL
ncbi:MAG: NAD(+) diphosphatase [Pseudomonadota bacterium]